MNLRRLSGAAAGLILLAATGAACSDDESVFNAEVGECIENLDDLGGTISELPETECTEDHEAEFFALYEHEGGDDDFDAERIGEEANEECAAEFEDYMGVEPTETRITFAPITPSEESWTEGDDRETICVAYIPGEEVDESFEDNGDEFPIEGSDTGDDSGDDSGDDTGDDSGDDSGDDTTGTTSLGGLTQDEIDDLVVSCEGGDMADCDQLYRDTNVGTPEEEIGATCGGRRDVPSAGGCEDEFG